MPKSMKRMFSLRHYGVVAAAVSTAVLAAVGVVGSASFAGISYAFQLAATSAAVAFFVLALFAFAHQGAARAAERADNVRNRGRIAGELHNSLALDLAYIAFQARAADPARDTTEPL